MAPHAAAEIKRDSKGRSALLLSSTSNRCSNERRGYLRRGLEIQQDLKTRGRLPPNQNWIGWFEKHLQELDKV